MDVTQSQNVWPLELNRHFDLWVSLSFCFLASLLLSQRLVHIYKLLETTPEYTLLSPDSLYRQVRF